MKASDVYAPSTLNVEYVLNQGLDKKVLKITSITKGDNYTQTLKDGREVKVSKLELHFNGVEMPLALNRTNNAIMVSKYGDETDKWIGKEITLKIVSVKFGRDMKDSIQIQK